MHIPTHILSGWVIANTLPLTARERLGCMVAATVADVDGLGWFFGEEAYWRYHHIVGHNLFVGIALSLGLSTFSRRTAPGKAFTFAVYLGLFHLHLLLDFYGSGIGWPIHYLWPIDARGWQTDNAWPLTSWQNYLAFCVLLAATIAIARAKRRTPLEVLAPRLEAKLFGPAVLRPVSARATEP